MKKVHYFLLVSLIFLCHACIEKDDSDPLDVYREIAYNALSSDVKATVVGDWRDADVGAWVDGNYLVTFQTTDEARGPVMVVVDPQRGTWVEILPR